MYDDFIDGVNWLVEKGIVNKDEIVIMGGFYGGYLILVGLIFILEVFVVGVDIVGFSNLIILMEIILFYWKFLKRVFSYCMGDIEIELEFLRLRLFLFFVDKI